MRLKKFKNNLDELAEAAQAKNPKVRILLDGKLYGITEDNLRCDAYGDIFIDVGDYFSDRGSK